MKPSATLKFLNDRLRQLQDRRMMIPRYVERPGAFLGKKDFSLADIPGIDKEIEECQQAIKAVIAFRNGKKTMVIE